MKKKKNIQKQLSEIRQSLENKAKSHNTIATEILFGTKSSLRISCANMKCIATNMTQIIGARMFSIKSLFNLLNFNKKLILLFLRHYHRVLPTTKPPALIDLKMEVN